MTLILLYIAVFFVDQDYIVLVSGFEHAQHYDFSITEYRLFLHVRLPLFTSIRPTFSTHFVYMCAYQHMSPNSWLRTTSAYLLSSRRSIPAILTRVLIFTWHGDRTMHPWPGSVRRCSPERWPRPPMHRVSDGRRWWLFKPGSPDTIASIGRYPFFTLIHQCFDFNVPTNRTRSGHLLHTATTIS